MPNVLVFNSDYPANPYMAGETSLGMLWNGSAYMARQEGAAIEIVWPKEGAIFWMDSLSIPAGAKNVDAAHKMIDFLLRPENAAKVAQEIGYPTPVASAKKNCCQQSLLTTQTSTHLKKFWMQVSGRTV